MHESVKVAVVQFKPFKGDYARSLAKVGEALGSIASQPNGTPDLVVFPESALSGYFLEGGVRDVAVTAEKLADDLAGEYKKTGSKKSLDIAIGFYEEWQNTLYNSALYVTVEGNNKPIIHHVHRKVFLPTYGLFDEERFVEHGHEIRAFDTRWGRAALLVCEDAWHSFSGTLAALDGAQIIIVPSASPARGINIPKDEEKDAPRMPSNLRSWERIAWGMSGEHGVFTIVAQLVGSEGGKLFSGGSTITNPGGEVICRGKLWEEEVLFANIDLDDITRTRADSPLLSDLRTMLPRLAKNLSDIVKN